MAVTRANSKPATPRSLGAGSAVSKSQQSTTSSQNTTQSQQGAANRWGGITRDFLESLNRNFDCDKAKKKIDESERVLKAKKDDLSKLQAQKNGYIRSIAGQNAKELPTDQLQRINKIYKLSKGELAQLDSNINVAKNIVDSAERDLMGQKEIYQDRGCNDRERQRVREPEKVFAADPAVEKTFQFSLLPERKTNLPQQLIPQPLKQPSVDWVPVVATGMVAVGALAAVAGAILSAPAWVPAAAAICVVGGSVAALHSLSRAETDLA